MKKEAPKALLLNIAAVERDTGLAKDTLRVWERRYGFPAPTRDEHGNRLYSSEDVEKLRIIRRLLDQGRRPAALIGASTDELMAQLDQGAGKPASSPGSIDEAAFLQLVRLHRNHELRATLQQMLLKQGLQRFVSETVSALNVAIGHAWMRGEVDVPEEHLYSEQVKNLLRNAISSQPDTASRPRILLTTFPEEQHGLGILMVEAMLVPEGASCVSLGTQTPLADISKAAIDGRFDIVALSFSSAFPLRQAVDGLTLLRQQLPSTVALWAGGAALANRPPRLPGVRVVGSLDDALTALREWRATAGASGMH
jgi:MerR family transcriptional regulator, light-induced transcriptional regulator